MYVNFVDASVARSLVDREFVEYKKHRYVIRRCGRTADDVTVADAVAKDECERSILVKDVPDDLMDAVVSLLESDSVGSGAVELRKRDSCTGTMLFTFVSKDGQSVDFMDTSVFLLLHGSSYCSSCICLSVCLTLMSVNMTFARRHCSVSMKLVIFIDTVVYLCRM